MIRSESIIELGELIQRLRTADRTFRVFGSQQHKYRLGRTLSETALQEFESTHQIKLPEDYRCFLA
jgi:hypothetical protein